VKQNLSEFYDELAIWEGHLSKVFAFCGFLVRNFVHILCSVSEGMLKVG